MMQMTFHLHLKRISKPKHTRLKFDLEKLRHPNVLEAFQAMNDRWEVCTSHHHEMMNNEDADMDSVITTFITALTETASEILGEHHHHRKKKPGSL